jgi:amino-acid N-acetyltransferase
VKVEKARMSDVPQMQKLVNYFAERGDMLPRALSEIYENIRDFFVVRDGEQPVACVSLHIYWDDLAEIRTLVVSEESQRQGLGGQLVETCLEEARDFGIPSIFCLTYKPSFFEKFGFRQVDKAELPRKVWAECYRCPKFPNCDEVGMICHL